MNNRPIARIVLGHPRVMFGIVMILTALAGLGITRLEFDGNPRATYQAGDEEDRFLKTVLEQFGSDENGCLIVIEGDLFNANSARLLRKFTNDLSSLGGVDHVLSLFDEKLIDFTAFPNPLIPLDATTAEYETSRKKALVHPLVSGQLLSVDGKRTLIIVELAGDELTVEDIGPVANEIRRLIRELRENSSLTVMLTGIPVHREELFATLKSELSWFYFSAVAPALGLATLIFRRLLVTFTVSFAAGLGGFWTLGWMGLIGQKINPITTVVPVIVIVVGLTDAVHLLVAVLRARGKGQSPRDATQSALDHLGMACVMTSLTTAIGFSSLTLTHSISIRELGMTCAIGAVLTLIAVLSVIPLLTASRLGKRITPPRETKLEQKLSRLGHHWADGLLAHRRLIAGVSLAITAGLAVLAFRVQPDATIAEILPERTEANHGLRAIDEHFGGLQPGLVVVEWTEDVAGDADRIKAAIRAATKVCDDSAVLNVPLSWTRLKDAIPPPFDRFVPMTLTASLYQPDARRALIRTRIRDLGSAKLSELLPDVREKLAALEEKHPGFQFRLTGTPLVAMAHLREMIGDLARSLGFAIGVIFFVMIATFRSLRLALISVLPNALPLVAAAAALVIADEPLRITGVITFSVCLGIAVDDTIHFINRFRIEQAAGYDNHTAVHRAFVEVNSALLISTLVLVTGFSTIAISDMPHNRIFAWLSSLSLTVALLCDLVVLPALLALFGRRRPSTADVIPATEP